MKASFSSGNLELLCVSADRQAPIDMLFESLCVVPRASQNGSVAWCLHLTEFLFGAGLALRKRTSCNMQWYLTCAFLVNVLLIFFFNFYWLSSSFWCRWKGREKKEDQGRFQAQQSQWFQLGQRSPAPSPCSPPAWHRDWPLSQWAPRSRRVCLQGCV